jgi:hypothetical protein
MEPQVRARWRPSPPRVEPGGPGLARPRWKRARRVKRISHQKPGGVLVFLSQKIAAACQAKLTALSAGLGSPIAPIVYSAVPLGTVAVEHLAPYHQVALAAVLLDELGNVVTALTVALWCIRRAARRACPQYRRRRRNRGTWGDATSLPRAQSK